MTIEVVTLDASESLKPVFPQCIVAIAGKEAKIRRGNASRATFSIKQCPPCIEPLHMFVDGNDMVLTILGKTYQPEPDVLVFAVTAEDGEESEDVPVKVRTLTNQEFFVVFLLEEVVPLEERLHDANIPITWVLDGPLAEWMAPQVVEWHGKHGDTYSALVSGSRDAAATPDGPGKTVDESKEAIRIRP